MDSRICTYFLVLLLTACATNQTTKHGQKQGKWVYYRTDGLIEREEFYKPIKDTISEGMAFQLGWKYGKSKDSIIYGEELIRIKEYRYNNSGELQRIEKIDTSFIFRHFFNYAPPAEER